MRACIRRTLISFRLEYALCIMYIDKSPRKEGYAPFEGAKRGRGLHRVTDGSSAPCSFDIFEGTQPRSQGDKAGEPEDHGHRFNAKEDELVGTGWEEARGEEDIWEGDEESPDAGEDQEVDLRRRDTDEVSAVIPRGDCRILVSCGWVGERGGGWEGHHMRRARRQGGPGAPARCAEEG